MKRFIGIVAGGFIGAVIAILIMNAMQRDHIVEIPAVDEPKQIDVQFTNMTPNPVPLVLPSFNEAAIKTIDGVVHIQTEYNHKSDVYEYFFDWRDFFGEPNYEDDSPMYVASGSGVIISSDGYIVTNNHVVEDADNIEVTLNDKRTYNAKIVGLDPSTDLALIKIEEYSLPFIRYGDSDHLKIGDWVLAVGNPFNLTSTVTAGIVSAKARNINILHTPDGTSAIESFIQTDAAVNRGNSGGALVNTNGELVGINAAIASGTGYYAGYSFAIPVNIVKKVANDLLEFGEVQRALIGVQIRDLDSRLADDLGIDNIKGVYVAGVTETGSAKEAGIEEGDVILGIDNVAVNSTSELLEIIGQKRPGDDVMVTISRNNREEYFKLTLRNKKGTTDLHAKSVIDINSALGATFEEIGRSDKERLDLDFGVQVGSLEPGRLKEAGIREGFIITRVDKQPITTVEDIEEALDRASGGVLIEGIYPNGRRGYYGVGL